MCWYLSARVRLSGYGSEASDLGEISVESVNELLVALSKLEGQVEV
jgi:hypothetical protein